MCWWNESESVPWELFFLEVFVLGAFGIGKQIKCGLERAWN